jgi:hypothetical protein
MSVIKSNYNLPCIALFVLLCNGCHIDSNSPNSEQIQTIPAQQYRATISNELQINDYCSFSPNDELNSYINDSKSKGINPQKNIDKLDKVISNNEIVLVPDASWSYVVRKSPNSYRYLTPEAYKLLLNICHEFMNLKSQTSLWNLRPAITSMLRTIDSIANIKNKSKSKKSSHLHGTTFDISYVTFYDESTKEAKLQINELNYLKELLACVVENHRISGKCYKTFEQGTQSHCIHIVCRS